MAELKSTSQEFIDRNYNGSDIRNAQVTREQATNQRPTDNRRMPSRQNTPFDSDAAPTPQPRSNQRTYATPAQTENGNTRQQNQTNSPSKGLGSDKNFAKLKAAKVRAKMLRPWVLSITTTLWSVQILPSLFSFILLGAAFEVADSWVADVVTGVLSYLGYAIGLDSTAIIVLFFVTVGASFVISMVNFAIAWFIYTINGIQSVYGKTGGELKHASVMLMLIGGLPGLSLIPWHWLWISVVTKYPQ